MTAPRFPGMIAPEEYESLYPQTPGLPQLTPTSPQMQSPITPQAPWAARFFGGADPLQQGIFSPEQAGGFGRQALFNAGLDILANSGPAPYKRGLGEILAHGVQAGQQSYQAGAQQALGQEGILGQRQAQRRLEMIRQRYAGKNDPQSLTAFMHDLIGEGTPEALAGARSISEYLKSIQDNATRGQLTEYDKDGTHFGQYRDPTTGSPIGQPFEMPQANPTNGLAQQRLNLRQEGMDRSLVKDWERRFYDPQRKAVDAYHLFQSHLAEARRGNPAATKSLISAFAANADSFNQLRLGMLQYLSNVNPSLEGRARIAFQQAQDGTLPPQEAKWLADIVQSNFAEIQKRVTQNYNAFLKDHPGFESHFTAKPEDFFGTAPAAPNTAGTGQSGFQFRRP